MEPNIQSGYSQKYRIKKMVARGAIVLTSSFFHFLSIFSRTILSLPSRAST
jgi:hypothetical protein